MTATDELRRMLDERGVKWVPIAWNPKRETFYHAANGVGFCADEYTDGVKIYTDATITPEQAIAATLGNVPHLPHFWTHDGTLHVELPKLPESISVRLPVQRAREVGSVRVWQYTLDRGTCHNISKVMDEHGQARFACSECSAWIDSRMLWNHEYRNGEIPWVKDCKLNFCPNCGRRIVGPTTNDVDAEVAE